ncbi:MAG: cytochrome C oxidase subunit IV family protein [Blastocatellia bacterium]
MAEHIVSRKIYVAIFSTLIILTILTIIIAGIDLGPFNTIAALAIAAAKATLVALFFMHVRYSSRLTQIVVISGLFWLGIMFVLTMSDYLTRGWIAYSR